LLIKMEKTSSHVASKKIFLAWLIVCIGLFLVGVGIFYNQDEVIQPTNFIDDVNIESNINSYMSGNDLIIKINTNEDKIWIEGLSNDRYKIEEKRVIIYNYQSNDKFNLHIGENSDIYEFGSSTWEPLKITTTGLILENVNTTFNPDGMNFQTSYLNINLSIKELLTPDEIENKATVSGYTIQDTGYSKRILLTGFTYNQYEDYGNANVSDLIGRGGTDYYSAGYYPNNYFQIGAYASDLIKEDEDISKVFTYNLNQQQANYNVSWKIDVTSHFNNLIINYELWYTNSTTQDLVYTWEDVYTDNTTELLAVNYQLNKYEDYQESQIVDRALMRYDNLYGDERYVNVTIAYPNNKELLDFSSSSNNFTEIDNQYNSVISKANNLGKTETLVNEDDFIFKSYKVLIQNNSENIIYFKIPSAYGEFNNLSIWIEGSFAGGTGESGDPYQIETWAQLNETRDNLTASYILMNDLGSGDTGYDTYASSSANGGAGWDSISIFTGTFNGGNNTINNIYINDTAGSGLFGGSEGYISNLRVININYTSAGTFTGGIASSLTTGTINKCFSNGSINGVTDRTGGLVGQAGAGSSIIDSYSEVSVVGSDYIGGLVGYAYEVINNSYSIGSASGDTYVGGLIGRGSTPIVSNSYWDNETSGLSTSEGGVGKTTAEMQSIETFNTWDIVAVDSKADGYANHSYIWNIVNGSSYPFLSWEYTEATGEDLTAPTYSNINHNQTVAGELTLFSSYWNDNTALNPFGQYIFSTNNTGTWVNESTVNFTATPSWANVTKTLNDTVGLSIGYRWFASDNASNGNNTEIFYLTTTSGTDSTPPTFTTIPTNDSIVYKEVWGGVTFVGTDETSFGTYSVNDTTNFQINSTGYLNVTGILGVGEYYVNVTINDSTGNENSTIYNLNITKATLSASLTNTDTWTEPYLESVTIGLSESNTGDGDVTYVVYRDGVSKTTGETVSLGVGTYDYVLNSTGGTNYSSSASLDSQTLTIEKISPSTNMAITGTTPITYGTTSDFSPSETNTGDGGCSYSMDLSNAVYGVGTTTFNYSTSGCDNYTAGYVTKDLIVNKATLSASITNDTILTRTYDGTSTTLGISESNLGDNDVTYKLYVNGVDEGSSYIQATAGVYSIVLNSTGGTNYSTNASLDSETLTINSDVTSPTIVNQTIYNATGIENGTIIVGQNLTINGTITDNADVDSVWATIWQGIIGGPIWLIQQLVNIAGDIWEGDIATNSSMGTGDINYTIYSNDTSGNEINESGIFTLVDAPTNILVTLNSPADASTSTTNLVTFNSTANISTGGAVLTNMSLWTNESGNWAVRNISSIIGSLTNNIGTINNTIYENSQHTTTSRLTYVLAKTIDNIDGIVLYGTNNIWGQTTENSCAYSSRWNFNYDDSTTETVQQTVSSTSPTAKTYTNPEPTKTVDNITIWMYYSCTSVTVSTYESNDIVWGETTAGLWNRTITEPIIWNVQACDSDGDCGFATSNYTVYLDAEAPAIEIESPNGTLDYGEVGSSETLNVTFTDSNLDSCWYNYNGTNISIDGCITGVENSTTFILEEDNTNMTIYSNDSAGNLNTTNVNWSYNLTEISQTYPSTSVESKTETYIARLNYNSTKYAVITGTLNLNGTEYSGTRTGTGNNATMTSNAIMPGVTEDTNLTAYWTIGLTDAGGIVSYNLTSHNVTVGAINLTICDAVNNIPFWNFTVLNESNSASINSTFEATFTVRVEDSTQESIFNFSDTTGTNSSFDFCISPGTGNYSVDTNIKLTKTEYVDKFYDYNSVVLTNSTREDNLYMLATGDSTSYIIHVVDVSGNNIDEAEVRVQRYYPGSGLWVTTEIVTTNYIGESIGHLLSEDSDYRFLVYQSGVSVYNSTATKIICETAPCTVTLVIPITVATGIEDVEDLTSTLTFSSTTNIFTYTYSDTSDDFDAARLYVLRVWPSNATLVVPCNQEKTTSSGIITCDISGQINGTYRADGYITRDSTEFLDKRLDGILGTNIFNAMGNDGIFWGIFIFIGIIMIGINRPSMAIIFGMVALFILGIIGMINIGAISLVAITAVGVILLMRVGRE